MNFFKVIFFTEFSNLANHSVKLKPFTCLNRNSKFSSINFVESATSNRAFHFFTLKVLVVWSKKYSSPFNLKFISAILARKFTSTVFTP
jgi:hypothetical protein